MIGAIIGDVAGSRFEWANHRAKDFEMFHRKCHPTDDSVMSLAVAQAILQRGDDREALSENAAACMQKLGRAYDVGYGRGFKRWIWLEDPRPYNSFGNGSAMRVGPCGFAAGSLEEAKELSAAVTCVTHNHPEGMKGAEAIAAAVYLARSGMDKEGIREFIQDSYYRLHFTIDGIRDSYKFEVSCQGSVPVALEAFFESVDFEDAVRTAISVGGDSDTIAAMAGAVAEAYYGVPEDMIRSVIRYLDQALLEILCEFERQYPSRAIPVDGRGDITVFDAIGSVETSP